MVVTSAPVIREPLQAHPGPQATFLSTPADIAIYGGAAGGGKTFGLLLECTRHIQNPEFGFNIFRRTTPQITNEGGLWDTSFEVFPRMKGKPRLFNHAWLFPSGAAGRCSHLEYETTIYDHDSSQICLLAFDQLEQFTEKQFFYMLTRNRSLCGVRPYCRAAANPPPDGGDAGPDPKDHWLRKLVDWWIGEDGFPIQERAGVIRYFVRSDNKIIWVDENYVGPKGERPKSLTFIAAKLEDNKTLMRKNPEYKSNLQSQARVDRERLLDGNWNVSPENGIFDRSWIKVIDAKDAPKNVTKLRYWDFAATEESKRNKNPDWTAGALAGVHEDVLYIFDMKHFRLGPAAVEKQVKLTADEDGREVEIIMEEEGGSSGKNAISHYQRNVLKGYVARGDRPTGDKVTRAKGWCAWAEQGRVKIVRAPWNHPFLDEVSSFPKGKRDQVDAVSGVFNWFIQPSPGFF